MCARAAEIDKVWMPPQSAAVSTWGLGADSGQIRNSDRGRSQRALDLPSLPFPACAGWSPPRDDLWLYAPAALNANRIQ